MPQVINSNISSLTAQRNLNTSQNSLNTSLQRLSSGLRINSAKDDAAGLAISERFTTQIRGLNQAQRNANDGISLAQTAEGDLSQITNNLQRIRELAVQSANATNSSSDRAALQLETAELIAEIDRVASDSAFNGVKLLDGSFTSQDFQVGANAGQTVSITSISSARTSALGQTLGATATVGTTVQAGFTAGDLTVNGNAITASADAKAIADAITASDVGLTATATNAQTAVTFADVVGTAEVAEVYTGTTNVPADGSLDFSTETAEFVIAINGTGDQTIVLNQTYATQADLLSNGTNGINDQLTGATATIVGGKLVITADIPATGVSSVSLTSVNMNTGGGGTDIVDFITGAVTTAGVDGVAPTYTLNIDGTDLDLSTAGSDGTITAAEVGTAINALSGYTSTGSSGTSLNFTKTDGSNAVLIESGSDSGAAEGLAADGSASAATTTFRGIIATLTSSGDLTIAGTAPGNAGLTAETISGSSATGTTIAATDISTVAGANAAIQSVDSALSTINTSRASLGAIQNRFESVVSSIQSTSENLSAARSRIRDTDFAEETAALTRAQILQQAGVSILSQANSLPQNVLALLQ